MDLMELLIDVKCGWSIRMTPLKPNISFESNVLLASISKTGSVYSVLLKRSSRKEVLQIIKIGGEACRFAIRR